MIKQLKNLLNPLSYIARRLPVGMTEFEAFAKRIIKQAGQFADEDSMKYALASQIIHSSHPRLPDQYFIRSLEKAAANQVASQVFQDIKNKQLEAQKKLAEQSVEATTQPSGASSDGQSQAASANPQTAN